MQGYQPRTQINTWGSAKEISEENISIRNHVNNYVCTFALVIAFCACIYTRIYQLIDWYLF